ncbi:MAG: menaquinone biosynthesis decarboxylase [Candidatus Omnitrophica bacterium]|nr:menaquinone biosynthesis decarboxylase [Candidatus Omnitrophota bacterium]
MAAFPDLQSFLHELERNGDLKRITVEVDPELEIAEIASRVVKREGPALLFERVKGSAVPLAINLLGTERRIEWALGRSPQQVGAQLRRLIEAATPPDLAKLWQARDLAKHLLGLRPRRVDQAASQELVETPRLSWLPIMKSWPQDGGRFITFGLVLTQDPQTHKRNVGLYRLQVFDDKSTGMHWQIQKGGGFHYAQAERQGQPLEVAVIIGADPALLIASVMPLPEGIDEIAFAGFLRGSPLPLVRAKTISLDVPAHAEIIIEGVVPPYERAPEGPFGDHFGHYSHLAPFPIFHVKAITHRRHPVYLSALVGRPPQEDKYIGQAVQEMMLPLVRVIHPEIKDLWCYYEAGFHSLAVVSVEERYAKEGMKTALGLLGEGQMALTKCLVIVDGDVDARNITAVLRAIRDHFDPAQDFLLLPGVPFDTLDFTSLTLNLGSKMVLDATRDGQPTTTPPVDVAAEALHRLDARITTARMLEGCLLAVQVESGGREVAERLVQSGRTGSAKIVAAVSRDVHPEDLESLLWGIFTRFDPARDVVFSQAELKGSWPVYRGVLGLDATWKTGYPDTIMMTDDIQRLVDRRWQEYGLA